MKGMPVKLMFLIGGLSVLAGSAFAVEATDSGEVESVLVTAKRLEETLPEQLSRIGMRLDVVTQEDIKMGGYLDVAEALDAKVPGLSILSKNGPFDYVDISLLGSRTQDVLWLVDGVRINNRLYAGTTPLDTLPAGMVQKIEVLDGGQALFYGTQAVAGAVNIVTKGYSATPTGQFTVGADTNGGRHVDANTSDTINGSQFVIYGSADQSDGYRAFRAQDYQPSDTDHKRGYEVLTLGGKYAYDFTDKLRLDLGFEHTNADLDFALPYRVARDVNSRREDLLTAKVDYDVSEQAAIFIKGYYHWWTSHYDTFYNDLANPGTLDVLYQDAFWGFKDYGVNAMTRLSFNKGFDYYLGYDLQRYNGHDDVLVIQQQTETTNAVFAQVRSNEDLIKNTRFAAGFRYNKPTSGTQSTIWNVSGEYDFLPGFFARGSFGTNFRLPTAEELYANDPQDERGNPNLKPEKSSSGNLSVGGKMNNGSFGVNFELIGFYRNISNLIDLATFDEVTGQDVFGNLPDVVKVRGAEFVVGATLGPDFSANLDYTYSRSREDGSDQQLSRVPETLLKAGIEYHPANLPLAASANLRHTGELVAPVNGNVVNYGNYTVVDLQGRYYFDSSRNHRFTLDLNNVFNKEYGRPGRGCQDVATDGPYDCSAPYVYVNRGLPRTLRASYEYRF
jgi:outer membrane cobalamin receptor